MVNAKVSFQQEIPVSSQEARNKAQTNNTNSNSPQVPTDEQAVQIMSRQVLKLSRQVAQLKSISVLVYMLQDQTEMVNTMRNHSIDYAMAFNSHKEDKAARDKELGPLHIRLWYVVVKSMATHFEQKGQSQDKTLDWQAKIEACAEYLVNLEKKNWEEIQEELQVFRLAKAFRKGAIKLEIAYTRSAVKGTTGEFMTMIYFPFLSSLGSRRMLAAEPKGDLERKIQAWLDKKDGK